MKVSTFVRHSSGSLGSISKCEHFWLKPLVHRQFSPFPGSATVPNSNSMMSHLTKPLPTPCLLDEPLRQYLKLCRPALLPHSLPVSTGNIDAFSPITQSSDGHYLCSNLQVRPLTTMAQNECRTGNATEGNGAQRITGCEPGAPRANQ